ncbi:glucosyltransferase domain-containing protein [Streptococcus suis]|uniref:glucosyltransferase domain-containing protein n=3 Tax=Streptococcus suis TaxID=1307 RepID=UPI001C96FE81|nr:glucosyltransferase domain-containing protein [Streptococcus suis]MBY4970151.1 glucosyltransferase domain-containing protein [Streptococcus suis]
MILKNVQKIIPPRWTSLLSLSAFFMLTVTHRTPLALLVMLGAIAVAYIYIYITEENGLGSIYDWSRYATYLPLAVLIVGGTVTKLFDGMGISFITTNILRILAIPIIAQVLSHFHRLLVNWWQGLSCEVATKKWVFSAKTSFAILFGIYLLGISALLRANVYYSDDNWRFSSGSRGWDDWSRFFTERSSIYFFGGKFAVDVSPYSQILAVAILALVGILLLGLLYRRKVFTIWEVVALVPLGLNPFFIDNLSYKFDAPFMAFSLLAAVFPLVFRFSGARWYVLACFLGSLLVLTSYQASFGIFPMLVILLLLRMWQEKGWHQELVDFFWQSLLGYGAGALYFYLVVMIAPRKDYLDVSIPALLEIPEFLLKNYTAYFSKVLDGFTPLWLISTLVIFGSFLVYCMSKKRNLLGFSFSLVSLVLMMLLSFGFYPILVEPQLNNRAMYGLVVVIVLCGLVIVERGRRSVLRLPILVLSYSFFVYALVYGNALATIDDYRKFRLQLVYEDLSHLPQVKNKETVDVYFPGKIPASPALKKQFLAYPMLAISHNEYWDRRKLSHLPTVQTIDEIPDKLLPTLTHLPMLVDTYYHTIYGDDTTIYVRLKEDGKLVE